LCRFSCDFVSVAHVIVIAYGYTIGRIEHIYEDRHRPNPRLFLHYGDLGDATNLVHIVGKIRPDEVYNLAAQSHVKVSFEMAEYTADIDGLGTLRLLDAIRTCGLTKSIRFYQVCHSSLSSPDVTSRTSP
jgi:GDPmannose 4,6-dehydratase